jgi:hypothetical protein
MILPCTAVSFAAEVCGSVVGAVPMMVNEAVGPVVNGADEFVTVVRLAVVALVIL